MQWGVLRGTLSPRLLQVGPAQSCEGGPLCWGIWGGDWSVMTRTHSELRKAAWLRARSVESRGPAGQGRISMWGWMRVCGQGHPPAGQVPP